MKQVLSISVLALMILAGCNKEEEPKLPSVEDRVNDAIESLVDALTTPANGWKLAYRPTFQTGSFFVLMDFNENGTVRIQSDVSANEGEFRDQIIPYRIDSSQGLELILETFSVFHFIFEFEENTFGGEFEFVFIEESDDNLVFRSKSDQFDITTLTFEPGSPTDSDLISTEAISILRQGIFQSDNLGSIGAAGTFNFYIPANNHTISATFELQRRTVKFLGIAEGQDMDAIIAANSFAQIDLQSSFSLSNESVILDNPQVVTFGGVSYEISEIPIEAFTKSAESFCTVQQDSVINIAGTASFGHFAAKSSPFQTYTGFQPALNDVYTVNYLFLYDENDSSISEQIEAIFPGVVAFQWYYDLEIADSLFSGIGFVTLDDFNNADFYLRGVDMTQTGNYVQLSFNNNDLITNDDAPQAQLDAFEQLIDEIFEGNSVYLIEFLNEGGLFEYYNPCNKHKGFLLP